MRPAVAAFGVGGAGFVRPGKRTRLVGWARARSLCCWALARPLHCWAVARGDFRPLRCWDPFSRPCCALGDELIC